VKDNNICRLCNAISDLQESHIIPSSIIKLVRDKKLGNKFYELHNKSSQIIQDGPKEYLLCQNCEQKIGGYEKYFKEAIHLSRHGIEIRQTNQYAVFDNLDYKKIKLFFFSLLWRMSVSSLPEFENVCIGDNEETIRQMIIKGDPGNSSEYPVSAIIPLINQWMQEGWATTVFVSKDLQIIGIVLGGILYLLSTIRQNSFFPTEWHLNLLNESGHWIMPWTDFYNIPFLREYNENRFKG